ncbi:histidine kinase [Saccharibacillus sp. O23]|uniref:hybrid sensor histidine kinase/response regulator n=1 Tax=Saccharibacillus sp. O23 TaxID=2009338 RepID=UPI000B4E7EED|nr:ATP-binding protein [Saccharibacillus sp. O23]OWR30816.1 histidine kinase [Saccharibacillus sp. O23]
MRNPTRQPFRRSLKSSPKTTIFLLLLLLLLALSGLRLILTNPYGMSGTPRAENGVLDLRGTKLDNWHTLQLDGEWTFYPRRFIESDPGSVLGESPGRISVPGDWKKALGTDSSVGYGSYRLRILTNPDLDLSYKLTVKDIQTSFRLYANGEMEAEMGHPAESAEDHQARVNTELVSLPDTNEIDLVVEVSNFENARRGGIARSLLFGSSNAINSDRTYNVGMQLITLAILLMHAVYIGIIYLFSRKDKVFLLFTLLLVSAVFSISLDEDKVLLAIWPFDYEAAKKIALFSYAAMTTLMLKLAVSFSLEPKRQRRYRFYFALTALYGLFIIFAPIEAVLYSTKIGLFTVVTLLPSLWVPVLLIHYIVEKERNAIFLLIAAAGMASTLVWGGFKNAGWVAPGFYPFDILIAFFGTVAYAVGKYFRNNSALTELAERLRQADKAKDEFLAQTSHELRTPLHGMINIADSVLATEGEALTERSRRDLQLLGQVGRRMNLLLGDLLDVSQIRERRISIRLAPVLVQSSAAGVLDMLRYMAVDKPLELELDMPDDSPAVLADEKRLTQILFNLVHNAIKFTPAGRVSVSARVMDDLLEIRVSDTGVGIAPGHLARIFDPYEQVDPLLGASGIGLGLAVSRNLIELHGSKLSAESEPGSGSVFAFSLPLADPYEQRNAQEEAKRLRAANPVPSDLPPHVWEEANRHDLPSEDGDSRSRILAVDDDPINLRVLRGMLPEERYLVVYALSGAEALELLDKKVWDLVIADAMMPNMSGYELTERIRERYSRAELPVLLLTARGRPEDIYAGFAAGANDYVVKPADALELNYRVKALTDLQRAIGERLKIEAAYLQAQIQPHFLFNALNSITALSVIDLDRMNETIEAFGSYLQISFDYWNTRQLVPLERELELVRSYLAIESMRFEDRLRAEIHIPDEVDLEVMLPPLSIQPLVENAVRHGVLSRSSGGRVSVTARLENDRVAFTVEDDGVGMDEKTLQTLLTPSRGERQGIGTLNTDRRLKKLYGSGLSIRSRKGVGTSVTFRVPLVPGRLPQSEAFSD